MTVTSFSFKDDVKDRLLGVLGDKESISQFAYNAFVEKINRMEKRDKQSRIELMKRDRAALKPVVMELIKECLEEMK